MTWWEEDRSLEESAAWRSWSNLFFLAHCLKLFSPESSCWDEPKSAFTYFFGLQGQNVLKYKESLKIVSLATKGAEVVLGFRSRFCFLNVLFLFFLISHIMFFQVSQCTKCVVGMTSQSGEVPLLLDSTERFGGTIIVFVGAKTRDSYRLWNTHMRCPILSCFLQLIHFRKKTNLNCVWRLRPHESTVTKKTQFACNDIVWVKQVRVAL